MPRVVFALEGARAWSAETRASRCGTILAVLVFSCTVADDDEVFFDKIVEENFRSGIELVRESGSCEAVVLNAIMLSSIADTGKFLPLTRVGTSSIGITVEE